MPKKATKPAAKKKGTKKKATKKKAPKKPMRKRKVHHWFFGVPRSVTVQQVLDAGEAVHHMLDSPLRDLCVIIQPDDLVRELRWFAFAARRRKNPYEYAPWVDTLADLAPLLVSVCHDDIAVGTELRAAAYVDHRRNAAIIATSLNGKTNVRREPSPNTAVAGLANTAIVTMVEEPEPPPEIQELAPVLVLREYAPNEPGDHYLTALDGKAYRYADGETKAPKPVARAFFETLSTPIDRYYPFS
jgi:hypothetical protein